MDFLTGIGKILSDIPSLVKIEQPALVNRIEKLGLVNVDTIVLNLSVPGTSTSSAAPGNSQIRISQAGLNHEASEYRHEELLQSSTVVFDVQHSLSDECDSTLLRSAEQLSVKTGMYLIFNDNCWWKHAPIYIDISPNVRLVSLSDETSEFPSIESNNRFITVVSHTDTVTVSNDRGRAGMAFKNATPTKYRGKIKSETTEWSLRSIRAGRLTSLNLNTSNVGIEYSSDFASGVWCLVNHHPRRGDEAYILLKKI